MLTIINVDDFGLTHGVNQGVLDCFLAGSITSATLMVNAAATAEAAGIASKYPALGIGLHFNITLGVPLCAPESVSSLLTRAGHFYPRSMCEKRLALWQLKREHIRAEFYTQVEKFISFGIPMTHIDSHQHVHLFPQVFDIVAEYCVKHDIPLRIPWIWRGKNRKVSTKKRLRAGLLAMLIRRNMNKWGKKLKTNRSFVSIFDAVQSPSEITPELYLSLLKETEEFPLELMVHPARKDVALEQLTAISHFSEQELGVLTAFSLSDAAKSLNMQPVTYSSAFQ